MSRIYLVRYGLARSVARFAVDPEAADGALLHAPLGRGEVVIVRTHRGTEIGEVLGEAPAAFDAGADGPRPSVAPLLRRASDEDRARARCAEAERPAHYDACQEVFRDGLWPIEVVDAEPLLDEGRTVLHYFGPHRLDASGLVAIFRDRHGLDVVLEPVGLDVEADEDEGDDGVPDGDEHACGSCGSKSGGGCGTCASSGGCAVKALVASRRTGRQGTRIVP